MDDILAIVGIAAMVATAIGLAIGLRWFLGDRDDSWAYAEMLSASQAQDWPVGVQEDEPFRWRMEALSRSPRRADGEKGRTSPRTRAPHVPRTATFGG
jgi:hypothetical protein